MKDLFSQTALVFYTVGVLSMLVHAAKKWLDGEIDGKLIDWYICAPKRTVAAILACLGGIAGLILSHTIYDYNIGAHITAAALTGFGADTLNGQGKRDAR